VCETTGSCRRWWPPWPRAALRCPAPARGTSPAACTRCSALGYAEPALSNNFPLGVVLEQRFSVVPAFRDGRYGGSGQCAHGSTRYTTSV
jgi:hypothetical protein